MLKQSREPELWTTGVVVVDAPSHSEKPAHILAYREVFRSTAEPRHVGLVAFQIRLVSGRMNHCGEFTVFVFFHLSSSPPRCLCAAKGLLLCKWSSHSSRLTFQPTVSPHYRAERASAVPTRTVIYGFQLITSDTEREVQGDFPWAVLTRSVTRAEFLASFFSFFFLQGWPKPLD